MSAAIAQDATARNGKGNQRDQTARNLTAAADGGGTGSPTVGSPPSPHAGSAKQDAARSTAALRQTPPCYTCKVRIKVAIFFDGTGNNLDADIGTGEHSNVARLFRAHPIDNVSNGLYRVYVPGLGTYFKEIANPGDDDGLVFGKRGEPRLQWAMDKIDEFVAHHQASNITGLDIALFGFSRGAALARAFALRLQVRCKQTSGLWQWDKGGFEARLYFMGLFDTVASVGLTASSGTNSILIGKGWVSLDTGLRRRRHNASNGLQPLENEGHQLGIAFGEKAGADPTPGPIDGHGAWASDLRIPAMALKCVHIFSTHEIRNSFPLDSVREGTGKGYPANTEEYWLPGVHSDVGGGYRPGEGGRSMGRDEALSLIALKSIYDQAVAHGVPLGPTNAPRSGDDFVVSDALQKSYGHYIRTADSMANGLSLEARMLVNRKLYLAWRFKRIRQKSAGGRADAADITKEEQRYATEGAQLDQEIAQAANEPSRLEAKKRLEAAKAEQSNANSNYYAQTRKDWADPKQLQSALARKQAAETGLAQAEKAFAEADDQRMRLTARKATLGKAGLVGTMDLYDKNLLLDVEAILETRKANPQARLRPHYANLIEAYEAEFIKGKGLLDAHPEVLTFLIATCTIHWPVLPRTRHCHPTLVWFIWEATSRLGTPTSRRRPKMALLFRFE